MNQTPSQVKWAENEVVFRKRNKAAMESLEDIKSVAKEEGQEVEVKNYDQDSLLFYCECANEKCRERIKLSTQQYKKVHKNNSQFIVIPGHHVPEIERVVSDGGTYLIVEKYMTPPQNVDKLNPTPL